MMLRRNEVQYSRARLLALAILVCMPSPVAAQSPRTEPTYADGVIQCPDGSTHDYSLGVPDTLVLHLACQTNTAGTPAALPKPMISDDLSSLRRPLSGGTLRCPDGSTRPWEGEQANDLMMKLTCAVPAEVATENHRRVQIVLDEKNREAQLQAALRGEAGVWEGLKATWEKRSPDYLLSVRPVWFIGIALLLFALIRIFGRK